MTLTISGYVGKKKQMKKRHPDVNEPLNIRLEKFKWHFHQAVEEIEKESI